VIEYKLMDARKIKTQTNYSVISNLYANDFAKDFYHFEILDQMLAEMKKRKTEEERIVDLGSGHGPVIEYILAKRQFNITAVDLSPEFCQILYRKYKRKSVKVECTDMVEYVKNLPDNSIGAFTANYAIIHIPDEEIDLFYKNLSNKLLPKGLLMASFYEGVFKGITQEPYQKLKDPRLFFDGKLEVYLNYFTITELKERLGKAGFNILRLESFKPQDPNNPIPENRIFLLAEKKM